MEDNGERALGVEGVRENRPRDIVENQVKRVRAKTNDGFCCPEPCGRFQ